MVKDRGQRLPPQLPAGLPKDDRHQTANLHSAAVRLLRTRARRTPTSTWTAPGPAASVLVFAGPQPMTRSLSWSKYRRRRSPRWSVH
jgi:hypothetical protein